MTFEEAAKLPKDHPARWVALYGATPATIAACTRNESHRKIRPTTATQQRILDALSGMPPLSRADIHTYTGISITSLCGRIAELVDADKVEVVGTKQDPVTKRKVVTYKTKGQA